MIIPCFSSGRQFLAALSVIPTHYNLIAVLWRGLSEKVLTRAYGQFVSQIEFWFRQSKLKCSTEIIFDFFYSFDHDWHLFGVDLIKCFYFVR